MGDRSYAGARLGFAPKGWMHSEARPNNGAFWRSLTRRPLHSCPPGRGATASWCYSIHVPLGDRDARAFVLVSGNLDPDVTTGEQPKTL